MTITHRHNKLEKKTGNYSGLTVFNTKQISKTFFFHSVLYSLSINMYIMIHM